MNLDVPDLDGALCREVDMGELFFPEKGGTTTPAKQICRLCPVREACLEYALEQDERFGVWGGLSERERRRLRRDASAVSAPAAPTQCERCGGEVSQIGAHRPRRYCSNACNQAAWRARWRSA